MRVSGIRQHENVLAGFTMRGAERPIIKRERRTCVSNSHVVRRRDNLGLDER